MLHLLHFTGTLLYQMGQVEEGERYLKYALKLNPNHHGALNNLKVTEIKRNNEFCIIN